MFEAPLFTNWVDIFLMSLIFALVNKLVQHLTINQKDYFYIKLKSKKINKEMKELSKVQDFKSVKDKQKEAFSLIGKQFSLQKNSIIIMFIFSFPTLWFINKYYSGIVYDFFLFKINSGFWAYIIIGAILSIVISSIYDKLMVKRYYPEGELKE